MHVLFLINVFIHSSLIHLSWVEQSFVKANLSQDIKHSLTYLLIILYPGQGLVKAKKNIILFHSNVHSFF